MDDDEMVREMQTLSFKPAARAFQGLKWCFSAAFGSVRSLFGDLQGSLGAKDNLLVLPPEHASNQPGRARAPIAEAPEALRGAAFWASGHLKDGGRRLISPGKGIEFT